MTTLNLSLPTKVEQHVNALPKEELHAYVEACLGRLVVEKEMKRRLDEKHPILQEALEIRATREALSKREAGDRLAELIGSLNEQ